MNTTNISKKETLANKVKQEIREINNIIRRMKIKTDNVHDQNIRQQIIQLLSMYVQNGDPLMYAVLNEMAKSMINEPSALKVITYEDTEVEIPECYVFFQDYVKNKISRLEKILTYDDSKPVQNNLLQFNPIGAPTFNPIGANTFNPIGANTFNPTGANTFNPTGASTFNPTCASTFNPTGASTFNPTCSSTFNPATTSNSEKTTKVTFGPTTTLNK
jgi:hypothetical protein